MCSVGGVNLGTTPAATPGGFNLGRTPTTQTTGFPLGGVPAAATTLTHSFSGCLDTISPLYDYTIIIYQLYF
jgi:hypothetical protein